MENEKHLPFREWFLIAVSPADPYSVAAGLREAGFDAFVPGHAGGQDQVGSTALIEGHLFVKVDPELDRARFNECSPRHRFLANEEGRPLRIPAAIVNALSGFADAGPLSQMLSDLAYEYRIEFLVDACYRANLGRRADGVLGSCADGEGGKK